MIDDIQLAGISEELEDKLIEEIGYDNVLSLATEYANVKSNIEYLKSIGLKNIEDVIINKHELFLEKPDELKNKFAKFNIQVLVKLINEDYSLINELF